jgi:hypothetical protein
VSAKAEGVEITIRNQSRATISRFYTSPTYISSWEVDLLDSAMLYPGRAIKIKINDGRTTCWYNFSAVFTNGKREHKHNVNICKLSTLIFN